MIFRFSFPVRTKSLTNGPHGHHRASAAYRKRIRDTCHTMAALDIRSGAMALHMPRIEITYRRFSCKEMDDDNLRAALKPVRDAVCDAFGLRDDQSVLVRHTYEQATARQNEHQVDVEVEVRCVTCDVRENLEGTERLNRLAEKLDQALSETKAILGLK